MFRSCRWRCTRKREVLSESRMREIRLSGCVSSEGWHVQQETNLPGWKRQHGDKDMLSNWRSPPRPGAKSSEQGRPYNRRNREVGRRREGGGWVRSSDEAEYDPRRFYASAGFLLVSLW